jgi:diacylglycerol kinase (ATP)
MSRQSRRWSLLHSGYHAFSGLLWLAPRVPSLKMGMALSLVLVALGLLLRFSLTEIAFLVVMGTMLLAVEVLNTAVEMLSDYVQPEHDPRIGKIKDSAAAATAFTEIGGVMVVLLILVPHVLSWLGR